MQVITVAVDAMSGDFGPSITVPAVERALLFLPALAILLVGEISSIESHLTHVGKRLMSEQRLQLVASDHVITDDTPLMQALRMAKGSSIEQMLLTLKQLQAQSAVSCANSSFLMGLAKRHLGLIPQLNRPALLARFSRPSGSFWMLDLGANLQIDSETLYQFALMGDAFTHSQGSEPLRVALLNVGTEQIKGSEQIKRCAERLKQLPEINFVGYIEADQLYHDIADIIVCDGFNGNICLKSTEGLMRRFLGSIQNFKENHRWRYHIVKYLAKDLFLNFKTSDPDHYNGAILLGLNQLVIKSHGGASQHAFYHSILEAFYMGEKRLMPPFSERFAYLMHQSHEHAKQNEERA